MTNNKSESYEVKNITNTYYALRMISNFYMIHWLAYTILFCMDYTKFFATATIVVTILTAVATILMMTVWRKERYDAPETIIRINGKITIFPLRILEIAIFYDALMLIVKLIVE